MSATTQVTTFSDLYTDLQNRVRVQTSVTATENQAKRYINIALQDMHLGFGEKFWWAHRETTLRTRPSYTTGTITLTQGSTTVTGSSTTWNTADSFSVTNARAGGKLTYGNNVYEVASVTNDTELVLVTSFIGDTVSGASYTYYEDDYALASDFLRPLDLASFSQDMEIPLIDRLKFRRLFARNNSPGIPRMATLIEKGPSGSVALRRRVRFWRPPSSTMLIPYTYVTNLLAVSSAGTGATALSSDTDEPIVPLQYRHAIVFHALANWYRDKKDDNRADAAWQQYIDIINRVVSDNEFGSPRPRLQPNVAGYRMRPWRSNRRYTTGTRFDELR